MTLEEFIQKQHQEDTEKMRKVIDDIDLTVEQVIEAQFPDSEPSKLERFEIMLGVLTVEIAKLTVGAKRSGLF